MRNVHPRMALLEKGIAILHQTTYSHIRPPKRRTPHPHPHLPFKKQRAEPKTSARFGHLGKGGYRSATAGHSHALPDYLAARERPAGGECASQPDCAHLQPSRVSDVVSVMRKVSPFLVLPSCLPLRALALVLSCFDRVSAREEGGCHGGRWSENGVRDMGLCLLG